MFHHCYVCGTSQSALRKECKFCSHQLQDSWFYKAMRWVGMIWRGLLRITLLYCVVLGLNIEPAAPSAVAMICAYFLLSHKAAQVGRIMIEQFSASEARLSKLEAAATQPHTTPPNKLR